MSDNNKLTFKDILLFILSYIFAPIFFLIYFSIVIIIFPASLAAPFFILDILGYDYILLTIFIGCFILLSIIHLILHLKVNKHSSFGSLWIKFCLPINLLYICPNIILIINSGNIWGGRIVRIIIILSIYLFLCNIKFDFDKLPIFIKKPIEFIIMTLQGAFSKKS